MEAAELRGMKKEEEEDFVLALQLQELWEAEDKEEEEEKKKKKAAAAACPEASPDPSLLRSLSVVDEAWELLDPSPDVHGLFVHFNQALFWGRLAAVEVSWSPRMTLYAIRGGGRDGMGGVRARLAGQPCVGRGPGVWGPGKAFPGQRCPVAFTGLRAQKLPCLCRAPASCWC